MRTPLYSTENFIRRQRVLPGRVVVYVYHKSDRERPKFRSNHVRPVQHCMEEHATSSEYDGLDHALYDAVLMMCMWSAIIYVLIRSSAALSEDTSVVRTVVRPVFLHGDSIGAGETLEMVLGL